MHVVTNPNQLELKHSILSIGNFDGVHLGHQMLLEEMQKLAQTHQKASIIMSFFPPSKHFFTGAAYLSTEKEKLELFEPFKPDAVILIPFNDVYTKTSKEAFLADIAHLDPHTIIVGENFRFGFERKGNLYDLSQHAQKLEVFNLKHGEGKPISSSRIRDLLKEGKIEECNTLLGRNYSATGKVIEGDKRGRSIGFPTANINLEKEKALPLGVFAVTVSSPFGLQKGMANVGPRPSFPNDPPSLEVNLFDFNKNLYTQELTVQFEKHLRNQRKFNGLEDLKNQLKQDEANARAFFS